MIYLEKNRNNNNKIKNDLQGLMITDILTNFTIIQSLIQFKLLMKMVIKKIMYKINLLAQIKNSVTKKLLNNWIIALTES